MSIDDRRAQTGTPPMTGATVPEPGRWLVDPWKDQLHWVKGPATPYEHIPRLFDHGHIYVFRSVCGQAALAGQSTELGFGCCELCETWLTQHRPCPHCTATGSVRAYRKQPGQRAIRTTETCGRCHGHGYHDGIDQQPASMVSLGLKATNECFTMTSPETSTTQPRVK